MESKKKALIGIVGAKYVLDDLITLDSCASDCSYVPKRCPWFVVRPNVAEQLQALVKWANETETPLIPVKQRSAAFLWRHCPKRT